MHKLICADWKEGIQMAGDDYYACAFADPPDNLGMEYDGYDDKLSENEYYWFLHNLIHKMIRVAGITWISYNAKWTAQMGEIINGLTPPALQKKHCIQTFTFGQHNSHDLGNGYRPIWRLRWSDSRLYPNQIRIESERQKRSDPRANPNGKIPSDVFDFPRVVGNSKQRRTWHKTQLHEGLVERCVKLSSVRGGRVLDPFAGTGTVLRVCRRIGRWSTNFEISAKYCEKIAEENEMEAVDVDSASAFLRCRSCQGRIVRLHENYASCVEGCGKVIPLQGQVPTYVLS